MVTVPGWSDDARMWALGLAQREADRCPGCGGDMHETLDPQYLWQPNPPAVCLRCDGLHRSIKAHEKHDQHRAMLHTVSKVTKPKPRKRGG